MEGRSHRKEGWGAPACGPGPSPARGQPFPPAFPGGWHESLPLPGPEDRLRLRAAESQSLVGADLYNSVNSHWSPFVGWTVRKLGSEGK